VALLQSLNIPDDKGGAARHRLVQKNSKPEAAHLAIR
jgi:hypothetical protein